VRDIAASALTPPVLPRDFVPRPALRAVLDGAADRSLTLVSAPPGFGKSLLLADWVAQSPGTPAAWVSLDDECSDPRRFWNTVLAALGQCAGVPQASRLQRLVVSRTTVELDFLDDLLRGLASLPGQIRLVLDDAHHLRTGPVVDQLRLLVRAHGPQVHLVLATRMDPPLPLARLRMDDELCEVRADRLRFARSEAETLLRRRGLRLDARQSGVLHERTGGWVAGLTLAARSLAGHPDPDGFLADFSGDERAVADYLVDEVLAGIDENHREVLRRTSVVDPVPAGLAVELCDREDAAEVLDELSRELGLVVRSATGHADYSVQELLRSYLLADLQRQGSALVADLHRRAALWWDRDGRPARALRHAVRSGDPAFVAGLLRKRAPELVGRGDHAVLRGVVDAVDGVPDVEAWRAALSALAHLERGDRAAVAAELGRVRCDGAITDQGLAALVRATGRLAGLDTHVADGEPLPPDPALAALVRAGRGTAHLVAGTPDAAHDDLVAALDDARMLGLPLLEAHCLCGLASAAWLTGDLHEAADAAAAVAAGGRSATAWAVAAQVVVALTALEQARPHAALAAADAGLRQGLAGRDPEVCFGLRVARGGALFDTGEGAAGLLELQQARAELGEHPVHSALAVTAALFEQRIALRLGYVRAASAAAGRISGRVEARAERLLMRAWTQLAAGAHRDAHATVAPLLEPSSRPARATTAVEARLVAVRALLEEGDRPAARQVLRAALDQALPLGAIRPFTLAPSAVRALLVDELVAGDERGRFAALVVAASHAGNRSAAAVLTSREHDVLVRLPSLLNLDEIADDMAVSVNTVKSHVRSIYDKLGVGTRRRAVLVAHEQGLLTEPTADRGATGAPLFTPSG
jgi:LuxR family maltose regulon positive regulatory protein